MLNKLASIASAPLTSTSSSGYTDSQDNQNAGELKTLVFNLPTTTTIKSDSNGLVAKLIDNLIDTQNNHHSDPPPNIPHGYNQLSFTSSSRSSSSSNVIFPSSIVSSIWSNSVANTFVNMTHIEANTLPTTTTMTTMTGLIISDAQQPSGIDSSNYHLKSHGDFNYSSYINPNAWPILFLAVFIVVGFVGNLLVCLAITLDSRLQNATNYYLFSLATTDLLVSVIVIPLAIVKSLLSE